MATNSAQIRELLSGANQLSTPDLSNFFQQIREILSRRGNSYIPQEEADLLLRIQETISPELLERAAFLHNKRRDETIATKEELELFQITETIEKQHLVRLELLTELAQRRGIPLRTVMDQLNIVPYPAHG